MLAIFRHNIFNILFFNIIWFACVVGRLDWLWATTLVLLAYTVTNFSSPRQLLSHIAIPAAIGISIDALLIHFNVFIFPASETWMPLWLIVLWIGFATTLTKSLAFFGKRAVLAIAGGLCGFPFSYLMGHRLGAVEFGYDPIIVASLLAAIWAVMLPAMFWVVSREATVHA